MTRCHEGAVQGTRLMSITSHLSAIHIQGHALSIVSGCQMCPLARLVATVAHHSGGFLHSVGAKRGRRRSISSSHILPPSGSLRAQPLSLIVWEQLSNTPKRRKSRGRNTRYKRDGEREKKTRINSKNVGF